MTRINVGYPPKKLHWKMLLGEHREIKRVPNVIKSGRYSLKGQPSVFKLGTGHVKFFYDKNGYLLERYKLVHAECLRRGFNVQDYSTAWDGLPSELMGSYKETPEAAALIEERIKERLREIEGEA